MTPIIPIDDFDSDLHIAHVYSTLPWGQERHIFQPPFKMIFVFGRYDLSHIYHRYKSRSLLRTIFFNNE